MEFGEEANKVLDKLAEILGPAGDDIIAEYARRAFWMGVGNAIAAVCAAVLVVVGYKVFMRGIHKWEEGNDEARALLTLITGLTIGFIALVAACCNLSEAFLHFFAPRAEAIKLLLSQLPRGGAG